MFMINNNLIEIFIIVSTNKNIVWSSVEHERDWTKWIKSWNAHEGKTSKELQRNHNSTAY